MEFQDPMLNSKKENTSEIIKITDPSRIITLANFISMLRALSAIPIIYSMANPRWNWITGILISIVKARSEKPKEISRNGREKHFECGVLMTMESLINLLQKEALI